MTYAGVTKQLEFFSDVNIFYVMLPNRSISGETSTLSTIFDRKVDVSTENSGGKVDVSSKIVDISPEKNNRKVDVSENKITDEEDWELTYFIDMIMSKYEGAFRGKRREQLIELFAKYRYKYVFNRNHIADAFHVSENTASIILNKCVSIGLIEKKQRGNYCFARNK